MRWSLTWRFMISSSRMSRFSFEEYFQDHFIQPFAGNNLESDCCKEIVKEGVKWELNRIAGGNSIDELVPGIEWWFLEAITGVCCEWLVELWFCCWMKSQLEGCSSLCVKIRSVSENGQNFFVCRLIFPTSDWSWFWWETYVGSCARLIFLSNYWHIDLTVLHYALYLLYLICNCTVVLPSCDPYMDPFS